MELEHWFTNCLPCSNVTQFFWTTPFSHLQDKYTIEEATTKEYTHEPSYSAHFLLWFWFFFFLWFVYYWVLGFGFGCFVLVCFFLLGGLFFVFVFFLMNRHGQNLSDLFLLTVFASG